MRVFTSAEHPQKHISEVTKTQLARQCNEQVEEIKTLRGQVKVMAQILIAMAKNQDALKAGVGCVTLDKPALDNVIKGEQIRIDYTDDLVILRAAAPVDVPRIQVPRVVGLN